MWGLFETSPGQAGYRLKSLEVFNWGTFHEGASHTDVWKIMPEAQNCLLTGANGSGKTTLVDALLALLVNPSKRFFNQSSGAKSKRDRSELSYVEGHYGQAQNEEQQRSSTQKLRPNNDETYSVILGVFVSEAAAPVTLAQVRYFGGGKLRQKYLVATLEMSIATHIQFSSDGLWVRKLKRQCADRIGFFDTFVQYAQDFQRKFGMRSEKALTLFNQTVGMKILGDLDEFIRTNMLEESTAEADFGKMMQQYQTLLVSFQALQKARIQLELLQPVYDLSHEHQQRHTDLHRAQQQKRLLEPWFARQQSRIWEEEIGRQNMEFDRLENKLAQQEQRLATKDEQRVGLEVSIGNNETTQKIKDLARDISSLERSKKQKENDLKDYNNLARKLELTENPDEGAFQENGQRGQAFQAELQQKKKQLEAQQLAENFKVRDLKKAFEQLEGEIDQLRNSGNKITGRVAEIHQEILEAVGASRREIPFIAELIQVRTEEKAVWNAAIEKLLHGFGLCLLVPENYYSAVNQFVHSQRDLKGKIKYFRVDKAAPPLFKEARALVNKLEFNEKSKYATWVESRIAARYNYLCVEDRSTFERLDKAMLPSGLSRNKDTHQRDDSQGRRPILGWDNKELLQELLVQAREVSKEIETIEKSLAQIGSRSKALAEKERLLTLFQEIKFFTKLDWQGDARQISGLEEQKTALENSNESLKTLREQLNAIKQEIKDLQNERDQTRDAFKKTEELVAQLETAVRAQRHFLENFDSDDLEEKLKILDDLVQKIESQLTYVRFINQKSDFEQKLTNKVERLETEIVQLERQIRTAMGAFKSPPKDVREKFTDWDSDTYNLKTEIDQLPEYVDRYQQIKNDNLAELEARFRSEFTGGAIRALAGFINSLEQQHDSIEQAITDINQSLRNITFNHSPDTYIQLERKDTPTLRVRDFRYDKLNSWVPDYVKIETSTDPRGAEIAHFVERVQPFIQELNDNEKWRQEVTDVRNWSEFRAREFYKADDHAFKVYENSGGLSGGEAAQLAYTVLGASLAHQFGISREKSSRSFRLIVVDEAFSKLDEDKSKYLLQLCKGLGLQLMVVTPLTSIHLLENDVSVIHWVTKSTQNKNKSTVRDIPILEYKEKKESLLAEETAGE